MVAGLCGALRIVPQLAVISHAAIDTGQGVNFHAYIEPDTVYVGQQATYEVGVFIDDQLRLRLRRNPEFVPPEPQGMLTYDLPAPTRTPGTRHVGGRTYEVHVFDRALFPLTPGRYEIPQAQLAYSLPLSLSFFSREEGHTLYAESLAVVAVAPPEAGRPPGYAGAVGDLRVDERLDPAQARVGNPVLLTVRVEGRGDVKLFPRPNLDVPWGSAVPAQERVRLDSASESVRGEKEFDWLVTPRDSGTVALPPVRYPYFNPYTERYDVAVAAPETLRVRPGSLAPADTGQAALPPPLAVRTLYRGALPPPFYTQPLFAALALAAPLPAIVLTGWRRPRRRRRAPPSAAARLRRLARKRSTSDALLVRRLFVRALVDRFDLPVITLTDRGALTQALRREGVTAARAGEAQAVLAVLDRAAFDTAAAPRRPVSSNVCIRAHAAYVAVVAEARRRTVPARTGTPGGDGGRTADGAAFLVAALLASGVAITVATAAENASRDSREFDAGLTSYAQGRFGVAATHFATAAAISPRSPDAWANAGTAAWATGDTADAVVGWQRAGRLEPWAADVHERLALVRAPQDGPIARLPPVPVSSSANIALAAWLAACTLGAVRAARRRRVLSPLTLAMPAVALALGLLAIRSDETAEARDLSVVGPQATLYAAPALAAEHLRSLDAGDIARTFVRDGAWTRVMLDGDRDGWVETITLTSIARPRPPG